MIDWHFYTVQEYIHIFICYVIYVYVALCALFTFYKYTNNATHVFKQALTPTHRHTHNTHTHTRTETEGQLEASSSSCFMSRRVSRRQQNLENFLIFNSHSTVFSLLYFNFCCTYFTYIVSFYFRRNYELSALKSFHLSLGSHAANALFILFAYYLRCVVVALLFVWKLHLFMHKLHAVK